MSEDVPANFDTRISRGERLDIMEDLLAHAGQRGYASTVFEKHKITSGSISNWGVSVKRGKMTPDPEKHPLVIAKYSKPQKPKKPKRTVRSKPLKPKVTRRKINLKQPSRADFERLASEPQPLMRKRRSSLSDLLQSVSQVETSNQEMVATIIKIRDICDGLLSNSK